MHTALVDWSTIQRQLKTRSGQAFGLLVLGLALWTWIGYLPPLANTNAGEQAVRQAHQQVEAQAALRLEATSSASILDGPRGDFERRGALLPELTPTKRQESAQSLAADADLLAAVASSAAAERQALQSYDAALMARTRDLGPLAETLRPATWPIVEHLKLYPPPIGGRFDWHPPDANFFTQRAMILRSGPLDAQVQAATEIGRSTYALRQLRELDATYRQLLDTYADTLQAKQAQSAHQPTSTEIGIAAFVTLLGYGLLLLAGLTLLPQLGSWRTLSAIVLLGLWWMLPWLPLALLSAALLVGFVAWRPGLTGVLPLISVPLYYRPRTLNELSFPLNETLFGICGLGLALHACWAWQRGWRPPAGWASSLWRRYSWAGLLSVGVIAAGALSLTAPLLVEQRVALRELRRTIIEPALWAVALLVLLHHGYVRRSQLIWAFTGMQAWIATDGIVRFTLGEGRWATGSIPRMIGILPSSTALGVELGAACAVALALAAWRSAGPQQRAARLVLPALALGTLLTFTRGAWLGVALVGAGSLLLTQRWRVILGLGGSAASVSLAVALLRPELLGRVLRLNEDTGSARQEIWTGAWNAIQAAPWQGSGLDQFAYLDAQRFNIPQLRFLTLAHPHNLVLDVWLQLGLAGLVVVGVLIGSSGWRLWHQRRSMWSWAALALLTQLTLHGMVDQTMLGGDVFYVWWMLVVLAAWPMADERSFEQEDV